MKTIETIISILSAIASAIAGRRGYGPGNGRRQPRCPHRDHCPIHPKEPEEEPPLPETPED